MWWLALLLLCLPAAAAEPPLSNRLARHPSPYLALHGQDPVAWQEWNAETLARARRENKLVFVSVGYFACHWCHVMQRESYRNAEIAALLNRHFIPVKVDRELNTGLDDALQAFSERLLRIAGWPLNAFVTPDGHPVHVLLYAPPDEFRERLVRLAQRWQAESGRIRALARDAVSEPPPLIRRPLDKASVAQLEALFLRQVAQEGDELRGGFGQVSKFPMSPQLALLMDLATGGEDLRWQGFLRLTLDQMAARGLRDHVGGGFFRYTVDPGWETPHFEKMLYDNAQLARLYLRAAERFKSDHYRRVGLGALDFMLETLRDADGGFHTSTSAVDAQGREGATYLWEAETIRSLLTPHEFAVARRIWRLDAAPALDGGHLPAEWTTPTDAERAILAGALDKLKQARAGRSLPKDDKRNAGLNGLALSALSAALRQDARYARAADDLVRFVSRRLVHAGGLSKAVAGARRIEGAELEDYAYLVAGLLDYAEARGRPDAARLAGSLARRAWRLFYSEKGWRREARPLLAGIRPEAVLADGATPSPSAVLLAATLRLDEPGLVKAARLALQWHAAELARDPFAHPTQLGLYRRELR
jgi:uncharacterized protein YyaL (SSP411 family)